MVLSINKRNLIDNIHEWNANRLDLFRLTLPDEAGIFNGVVRFFFQNTSKTYQTKCIRISNRETTFDVVSILLNKFFPQQTQSHTGKLGLYEHHFRGVRRLANDEFPLMVQLNWNAYAYEGKFVLRFESENRTTDPKKQMNCAKHSLEPKTGALLFRRRWSSRWRRDDKGNDHAPPIGCAASIMRHDKQPFSESRLNCLIPTGNSKRLVYTMSVPDATSSEKYRCTLQTKVHEMLHNDCHSNGGTLKIYGGDVCPAVPYKTVLLSGHDRVGQVVRQSLEKYGLTESDPDAYCLTMRTRSAFEAANGLPGFQEILPNDRPLLGRFYSWTSNLDPGTVVTFELHHRPPGYGPRRHPGISSTCSVTASSLSSSSSPSSCNTSPLPCVSSLTHPCNDHCQSVPSPFPCRPSPAAGKPSSCTVPVTSTTGQLMSPAHNQHPPIPWNGLTGQLSLPHLVEIASNEDPNKSYHVHTLPVHSGEVCIGTAARPDREHPLLVSLSPSTWPDVEPHHLLIWRPAHQLGKSNSASCPTLGWLACRPCISTSSNYRRPSLSHLPLCKVYVNNQLLVASHYNQAAVHWLSPGDLIRFGHQTDRQLQIWPGPSPTRAALMQQPVGNGGASTGSLAEEQLANFAYLSPLVQNSPHMFIGPFSPAVDRSTLAAGPTAAVTNAVSGGSSTATIAGGDQNNTSPSNSSSYASSSSLSGAAKVMSPGVYHSPATGQPGGDIDESVTGYHHDPWAPVSPKSPSTSHPGVGQEQRVSVTQVKLTAAFHPIPRTHQQSGLTSSCPLADETAATVAAIHPTNPPGLNSSASAHIPSGGRSSQRSGKSSSSTVSDRLPCQLAFAPGSVQDLLDWIITDHLQKDHFITQRQPSSPQHHSGSSLPRQCPLGPALTVYLMLRAIHRQCDRWEVMEKKRAGVAVSNGANTARENDRISPTNLSTLYLHQLRRRQRELLTLLVGAVERFQNCESWIGDRLKREISSSSTTAAGYLPAESASPSPSFIRLLGCIATWLANSSQLLHLVTRDVDLIRTFQSESNNDADGVSPTDNSLGTDTDGRSVSTAWGYVIDQLAEVVQSAFGLLTELCSSQLDQAETPHLVARLESGVLQATGQKPNCTEPDKLIPFLDDCLTSLYAAQVNPAFTVQLFARLLHRLNARLFNFLLDHEVLSPSWGRALHSWLHDELVPWAVANGLAGAVDCYLTRVSQAAELLLADVSCVESLYNSVVDLVGLNSRQVGTLLAAYRFDELQDFHGTQGNTSPTTSRSVSEQWIDFVVSGVQLVADRILADQQKEGEQEADISEEKAAVKDHDDVLIGNKQIWDPHLHEPLNLQLPLLLPEDGFSTDTPQATESSHTADDPKSYDSGISSRPGSAKNLANGKTDPGRVEATPAITVDSVRAFLDLPIKSSWCRLSVRPLPVSTSPLKSPDAPLLAVACSNWDVYLRKQACPPTAHCRIPLSASAELGTRLSAGHHKLDKDAGTQPSQFTYQVSKMPAPRDHVIDNPSTAHCTEHRGTVPLSTIGERKIPNRLCPQHQPITVIVPKVGQSLGLSIVAVKSENDRRDLGIYIRGILPEGGASQAYLPPSMGGGSGNSSSPVISTGQLTRSNGHALQPGDHLLAVDGQPVTGLSQEAAAQLVASGGDQVRLTIIRHLHQGQGSRQSATNGSPGLGTASTTCVECELRACLGASSPICSDTVRESAVNPETASAHRSPATISSPRLVDSAVQTLASATCAPAVDTDPTSARAPGSYSLAHPSSSAVIASTPCDQFNPIRAGSLPPSGALDTSTVGVLHRQSSDTMVTVSPDHFVDHGNQMAVSGVNRMLPLDNRDQVKSPCYRACEPFSPTNTSISGQSHALPGSASSSRSSPTNRSGSGASCRWKGDHSTTGTSISLGGQSGNTGNAVNRFTSAVGSRPPETFVPTSSVLPCRERPAQMVQHKLSRSCHVRARSSRSLNDLRPVANVTYLPSYQRQQATNARCGGDTSSLTSRRAIATPIGGPRALLAGGSRSLQRRHTFGPASNWCSTGPRPEPPNQGYPITANQNG